MNEWLFKLVAWFPAIVIGLISYYFLDRGEVFLAAILVSFAAVLALCVMFFCGSLASRRGGVKGKK